MVAVRSVRVCVRVDEAAWTCLACTVTGELGCCRVHGRTIRQIDPAFSLPQFVEEMREVIIPVGCTCWSMCRSLVARCPARPLYRSLGTQLAWSMVPLCATRLAVCCAGGSEGVSVGRPQDAWQPVR